MTKVSLVLFSLTIGIAAPGWWGSYAVFLLVILSLGSWARIAAILARRVFYIVLPFAASMFLIQGFLWHGGEPIFTLGPLTLKLEGVLFAAVSTGRIMIIVGSFMLLTLTTRPDELMIALNQRGLPPTLTYIVLATIQIVPRFRARARTILDSQRARGLETEGNLIQRGRSLLPLIVPLVLSSIVDVEQRAIALEARAFTKSGPKTSYRVLSEQRTEPALRLLLLITMAAAAAARLASLLLP